MSDRCTAPLNRAAIGPILIWAVAFMSVSDWRSRVSQPGMLAFSTAVSLSACHTAWRGASMRRSPVMSIGANPALRGGRYWQGPAHATEWRCEHHGSETKVQAVLWLLPDDIHSKVEAMRVRVAA